MKDDSVSDDRRRLRDKMRKMQVYRTIITYGTMIDHHLRVIIEQIDDRSE